jgi:hypothetical protein
MTEWNIQSRAHQCQSCGKHFSDKEVYHTLLFDEKSDFQRSDICQSCWDKQYGEGGKERKGFISYWHGVYQAPPPPSDPIKKETAETLLRKVIELNDPHFLPAAYILAVMLERKRLLKVKEQLVRDGQRIFVYEQPATGDVFTIADPNLQLNQLEAVQRDVGLLLEQGLNPPERVPDSSSVESAPAPEHSPAQSPDPNPEPAAAAPASARAEDH